MPQGRTSDAGSSYLRGGQGGGGSSAGVCIIARASSPSRSQPMTRLACAALLLLSGLASVAHAADAEPSPRGAMPQPTESGPPARASEEGGGGAGPVVPGAALAEEGGPQRPADLSYGVAARLRWISVPAW